MSRPASTIFSNNLPLSSSITPFNFYIHSSFPILEFWLFCQFIKATPIHHNIIELLLYINYTEKKYYWIREEEEKDEEKEENFEKENRIEVDIKRKIKINFNTINYSDSEEFLEEEEEEENEKNEDEDEDNDNDDIDVDKNMSNNEFAESIIKFYQEKDIDGEDNLTYSSTFIYSMSEINLVVKEDRHTTIIGTRKKTCLWITDNNDSNIKQSISLPNIPISL